MNIISKKVNLAPIVLFVYNRLDHTRQTIKALRRNKYASESSLFIYSDAAKNNAEDAKEKEKEVREYIKTIDGFKKVTIIERDKNWGLANSIIDGVTKIVNEYGKIIVLEDDLVTNPYFLKFMNEALEMYQDEPKVVSIHGYIYPIENLPETFFIRGADCWGWATWAHDWKLFESEGQKLLDDLKQKGLQREADFNNSYGYTRMLKDQIKGRNDSWAIRWYMSAFLQNKLTLYPKESLVQNIGNDGSGTHCNPTEQFFINNLSKKMPILDKAIEVEETVEAKNLMEKYLISIKPNLFSKCLSRMRYIIRL